MLILYITYVNFEESQYGSSVRPQKMYRAFLEEGHEVKLLCGSQKKVDRAKRKASVEEIRRWLIDNKPDLCYIESPVYPILWHFDRKLIRDIHAMGVPCGYFTRDCYDRFHNVYAERENFVGRCKDLGLKIIRRWTERTLQCVDITYFPVMEMTPFFRYKDMRALPPAAEEHLENCSPEERRCLYVGGITNRYGGEMMLKAFHILNRDGVKYPLTLVCREKDWNKISPELRENTPWLELHHTSGAGLIPLLSRASAGLIIGENQYWEYTIPIKLYEYMGYGLPVIYVNRAPLNSFMAKYPMGVGSEPTPESFAEAVRRLFEEPGLYESCRQNAVTALREDNLWKHRIQQIVRELTEKKE